MKIGYACINTSLKCSANSTFRLKNYSEENLIEKVTNNLNCLKEILKFNLRHNLLIYRISSAIIPFASHEVCKFNWQEYFKNDFDEIGNFIKKNNMRVSMHPDQFVILNAKDDSVVKRSIAELKYHCDVLDAMNLDSSCKVNIHVGGVYGDKKSAISRFISNYKKLPDSIKKRLVIENDDKLFSLKDCLYINSKINIPIVFDFFHHECLNNNESLIEGLKLVLKTWNKKDGLAITHYSNQKINARQGSHSDSIDLNLFKKFLDEVKNFDFDIELEVKDKDKSAIKTIKFIK